MLARGPRRVHPNGLDRSVHVPLVELGTMATHRLTSIQMEDHYTTGPSYHLSQARRSSMTATGPTIHVQRRGTSVVPFESSFQLPVPGPASLRRCDPEKDPTEMARHQHVTPGTLSDTK